MKNIFKKWWFWLLVIIVIVSLILLFAPLKGCGVLTYGGDSGVPTGSSKVYISYFDYWTKGCVV